MSITKLRVSSNADAMKPDERNDSQDTFIRQTIGKEPSLSFARTNDGPVQWIQLLHALDQQGGSKVYHEHGRNYFEDLLGWPLLTPLKVQMQKCDKCSREFCSPINYRRHIRVHRRSLNVDKESHRSRDLLGAFWDKISLDEAKEIVSFNDVTLEDVPGSSIVKALASLIRSTGYCALPQVYVKAGSVLLDVIQASRSRLPISSQELFCVLDDASERTFLCAGTAESMQKYVFDGEAGKIGLEMKNLIACTSFLVEQKLVKAWMADKDAEALRCQQLLVEEEEAAQRRQAELLERKKQRKLRQKEQKTKEQAYEEKPVLIDAAADTLETLPSARPSSTQAPLEGDSPALEAMEDQAPSLNEPVLFDNEEDMCIEAQGGFSSEHLDLATAQHVESQKSQGVSRRHLVISRWQVPKSRKGGQNRFHPSQNLHLLKPEPAQKHISHKDSRAAPVNGSKVWTRKAKIENGGEPLMNRIQEQETSQTDQTSCEVMIGSISVTVKNCTNQQGQINNHSESPDGCSIDHVMPKKEVAQEKLDFIPSSSNQSSKFHPLTRDHMRGQFAVQSGNQECEDGPVSGAGDDRTTPDESCLELCELDADDSKSKEIMLPGGLPFSSHAARVFLAQRWKEAISGDHVTLVLSAKPGSHGSDAINDCSIAALELKASDNEGPSTTGSAENHSDNVEAVKTSINGNAKEKFRTNPKKGSKIK